eukprot:277929_1
MSFTQQEIDARTGMNAVQGGGANASNKVQFIIQDNAKTSEYARKVKKWKAGLTQALVAAGIDAGGGGATKLIKGVQNEGDYTVFTCSTNKDAEMVSAKLNQLGTALQSKLYADQPFPIVGGG